MVSVFAYSSAVSNVIHELVAIATTRVLEYLAALSFHPCASRQGSEPSWPTVLPHFHQNGNSRQSCRPLRDMVYLHETERPALLSGKPI